MAGPVVEDAMILDYKMRFLVLLLSLVVFGVGGTNGYPVVKTGCFYEANVNPSMYKPFCATSGNEHRRLHVGNFNSDSKTDLLCHDKKKNTLEILYTTNNGAPRTHSDTLSFCTGEQDTIHVADFNGDKRSDLLCHEHGKKIKILHTNSLGSFKGSKIWKPEQEICAHENSHIQVGDINGDGRMDVVCRHPAGGISIAPADNKGYLPHRHHADIDWCGGEESTILLGDFNNDKVDDMLCFNKKTGHKSISITKKNQLFLQPGSWKHTTPWCINGKDPFLIVTDVNGDGYMDLVCKDQGKFGTTKVQLNKPGDYFVDDPEYNLSFSFCFNSKKENFFLGDFNGDMNADLMCQAATGRRQINVSHCN